MTVLNDACSLENLVAKRHTEMVITLSLVLPQVLRQTLVFRRLSTYSQRMLLSGSRNAILRAVNKTKGGGSFLRREPNIINFQPSSVKRKNAQFDVDNSAEPINGCDWSEMRLVTWLVFRQNKSTIMASFFSCGFWRVKLAHCSIGSLLADSLSAQ